MKRFLFGFLVTLVGLAFSAGCIFYAAFNPCVYNGIDGLLGSLLCVDLLLPFILSLLVVLAGVFLCWVEAYRKN